MMIDKKRLEMLDIQIAANQEELKTIQKERKAAGEDPAAMVMLNKREKEIRAVLEALQRTRQAVTYVPPAPTSIQQIVSRLDKYILEKKKKVQHVQDSITENARQIKQNSWKLQKATAEGDVEAVVTLSRELEQAKERENYLQQMLKNTEALPTFPDGVIGREWEEVCESKRSDWVLLLHRIIMLADEYRAATDELLEMNTNLLRARDEMKRIANEYGAVFDERAILTDGIDVNRLKISKGEGMRPASIGYANIGRPTL